MVISLFHSKASIRYPRQICLCSNSIGAAITAGVGTVPGDVTGAGIGTRAGIAIGTGIAVFSAVIVTFGIM